MVILDGCIPHILVYTSGHIYGCLAIHVCTNLNLHSCFSAAMVGTSTEGEGVLQPHQVAVDKQEL